MFQSLFNTGQDAILANASATGGLRGGNTENSLARFGGDTLSQVIQNQLANLGGLSGQGQSAVGTGAGIGANTASQVAGSQAGQGNITAGGILGRNAVTQQMIGSGVNFLNGAASTLLGMPGGGSGDLTQILSGSTPGGSSGGGIVNSLSKLLF